VLGQAAADWQLSPLQEMVPSAPIREAASVIAANAAESAAARNLSRKPARDQAKEKPRNKAVRFEPDSNRLLREHICGEHETSWWKPDCS